MLVNKIHFQPKMQWMICTMLDFVGSFSLDIWRIDRYVCFWPLWFGQPTVSSAVIMFSSVRVCFSLPVSCLWSVLHVSQTSVNNIPTPSLLQFIFINSATILRKLYYLIQYKFLIRDLAPLEIFGPGRGDTGPPVLLQPPPPVSVGENSRQDPGIAIPSGCKTVLFRRRFYWSCLQQTPTSLSSVSR